MPCIRKLNAWGKKSLFCVIFLLSTTKNTFKALSLSPPPPNDTYTVHLFSALVVTIRVTTEEDKTPRKPSANFRAIPVRDTTWTT